jgi:hypothetical protein
MGNLLRKAAAASTTIAAMSLAFASTVSAQTYRYDYTTTAASDAAAGGIFAGFGLIWCCIMCVPFVILLGLAIFVYKDAEKNKVENGVLWAILTFFTGIIGLLIYLLAIKPEAIKKNGGTPSTPTAM